MNSIDSTTRANSTLSRGTQNEVLVHGTAGEGFDSSTFGRLEVTSRRSEDLHSKTVYARRKRLDEAGHGTIEDVRCERAVTVGILAGGFVACCGNLTACGKYPRDVGTAQALSRSPGRSIDCRAIRMHPRDQVVRGSPGDPEFLCPMGVIAVHRVFWQLPRALSPQVIRC